MLELYDQKEYARAMKNCERILENHPTHPGKLNSKKSKI